MTMQTTESNDKNSAEAVMVTDKKKKSSIRFSTDSFRSMNSSETFGSVSAGDYASDDGSLFGPGSYSTSRRISLMRTQKERDPMRIYSVLEVLGEGSMGRVCRVQKRKDAVGGSSRPAFVRRHKGCCFQLFGEVESLLQKWFQSPTKLIVVDDNAHNVNSASTLSASGQLPAHAIKSNESSKSGQDSSTGAASIEQKSQTKPRRRLYKQMSSTINCETHKDVMYALKSIHLDRCSTSSYVYELKNEVEILKQLDHPNIVRAIETFDYRHRLYIVLELCSGGDLYVREPYTEKQALSITKSLVSAVAYLHSRGIIHRDLKFENIMFVSTSTYDIKLIDFGLSQKFAANELLHDQVGTVYTMAPELLAGDYTSQADVWSIGVISFMLLSSSMPFYGKTRVEVIKRIIKARYRFSARRWATISNAAMDFVSSCLTKDPDERPTAKKARNLQWLTVKDLPPTPPPTPASPLSKDRVGGAPAVITTSQGTVDTKDSSITNNENNQALSTALPPSMASELDQMDQIQSSILSFSEYSRLKKLALLIVAYKSTTEEIGFLSQMFEKFDTGKDGEITEDEFQRVLSEFYDYSAQELEVMFRGIDVDGTGSLHYSEFLAATLEAHGVMDEERLAEAFDRLDSDDSGYITVADLRDFLGDDVPNKYLDQVIDEVDIEGDHRISYREFIALWSNEDDDRMSAHRSGVVSRHLTPKSSIVSSISSNEGISDDEERSETQQNDFLPVGRVGKNITDIDQGPDSEGHKRNSSGPLLPTQINGVTKGTAANVKEESPRGSSDGRRKPQSPLLDSAMKSAMESTQCFRTLHAQSVRPMVEQTS